MGRTDRASETLPVRTASSGRAPDADRDPVVRLVGVEKRFGTQPVLRGVSHGFSRGRTTVVMGPSGCGKTVMLKHIIALIRCDAGEVWYEKTRIDRLDESDLGPVRRDFGFLFQQGALFDSLSVHDNVAFPLDEHTRWSGEQRRRRVGHVLDLVGLAETADKMPAELSGGQQKRIALARAIALEPKVILYDEPTTGLDPVRADLINELIIKLQEELHTTSIVVTHDLASAFKIADEMVMLHEGRILMHGTPEEFRATDHPVVARFLRGEALPEELAAIRPPDAGGGSPAAPVADPRPETER